MFQFPFSPHKSLIAKQLGIYFLYKNIDFQITLSVTTRHWPG